MQFLQEVHKMSLQWGDHILSLHVLHLKNCKMKSD